MISEVLYYDSPDATESSMEPVWWENFKKANKGSTSISREVVIDERNRQLLKYNAQTHTYKSVHSGTYRNTIDFYDEKAYAWFMLKYS